MSSTKSNIYIISLHQRAHRSWKKKGYTDGKKRKELITSRKQCFQTLGGQLHKWAHWECPRPVQVLKPYHRGGKWHKIPSLMKGYWHLIDDWVESVFFNKVTSGMLTIRQGRPTAKHSQARMRKKREAVSKWCGNGREGSKCDKGRRWGRRENAINILKQNIFFI